MTFFRFLIHLRLILRRPGRKAAVTGILLGAALLAACAASGQMDSQPRYDPLSASSSFSDGRSARPAVPGAVPYYGDLSANSPVLTGVDANGQSYQGFPLPVTQDLITLGQQRYTIYCVPCHGASGKGDGQVIAFGFSKPPDLLGSDIQTSPNGDIFAAISNGFGKMYPYGYKVNPTERWAIIAYIRALELQNGPVNPQNLTSDQLNQIGKHP
jgi:mono/diheme cytochrome c family protein